MLPSKFQPPSAEPWLMVSGFGGCGNSYRISGFPSASQAAFGSSNYAASVLKIRKSKAWGTFVAI